MAEPRAVFRCNVCACDQARALFVARGYHVVRCRRCGLIALADPPAADRLAGLYDEGYFKGADELAYEDYLDAAPARRQEFRARLGEIARLMPVPGRVLEVGAAYGLFLDEARRAGWDPVGVEVSPEAARYAREELGLTVFTGDLASAPVRGPFDLAVLWDVIEHLADPLDTIRTMGGLLRCDGLLVLTTANAACAGARLYGARWNMVAPPWHLYYFTERVLRRLMGAAGMQVVSVAHAGNPLRNSPARHPVDRVVDHVFCNRWTNGAVIRAARLLRGGLTLTVYSRKAEEPSRERAGKSVAPLRTHSGPPDAR